MAASIYYGLARSVQQARLVIYYSRRLKVCIEEQVGIRKHQNIEKMLYCSITQFLKVEY